MRFNNSKRDYSDPQYKAWRVAVYKRDKFCCRWPGCKIKKRLNAHHIYTWAQFPALRFIVDNGITLCYQHHKMVSKQEATYAAVFMKMINEGKKNG